MIKYDLRCAKGHGFEAWFQSGAAYDEQVGEGRVLCPYCGEADVGKAPMAPRIGRNRPQETQRGISEMLDTQRRLREVRAQIERDCDYVGDRFAEEARRIHFGEVEQRSIYGEASDEDAKALADDGVTFTRIPWLPRSN